MLCGIPIGLKDLYAVRGLKLTASSHVLDGHVASRHSVVWKRLREAGMVPVGHTHTHEFGAGATTDQVGNPWNRDLSPGGSSGGSAAALAAMMIPAATGTDTGGSLRVPAAFCGVSAIKPTRGLVPMGGVIPVAESLDHAGPMGRTVADCAVLLQGMTDGRGLPRTPWRPRRGSRPLAGVRVALTDRLPEDAVDPDVADGFERVRSTLERLGARLVLSRCSGRRGGGGHKLRTHLRGGAVGVSPAVRGPRLALPSVDRRAGGYVDRLTRGGRLRPGAVHPPPGHARLGEMVRATASGPDSRADGPDAGARARRRLPARKPRHRRDHPVHRSLERHRLPGGLLSRGPRPSERTAGQRLADRPAPRRCGRRSALEWTCRPGDFGHRGSRWPGRQTA